MEKNTGESGKRFPVSQKNPEGERGLSQIPSRRFCGFE
jgi:hypothetical protein